MWYTPQPTLAISVPIASIVNWPGTLQSLSLTPRDFEMKSYRRSLFSWWTWSPNTATVTLIERAGLIMGSVVYTCIPDTCIPDRHVGSIVKYHKSYLVVSITSDYCIKILHN